MRDGFGREIDYLRISVTDRCNLRCRYCMPEDIETVPMTEILSFEEITEVVNAAAELGVKKVRVTGGEPLVRRNVTALIRMLKEVDGIEHVSLTTNGIFLTDHIDELKEAGIDGINVSLDTLDKDRYRDITGYDGLDRVLDGITAVINRGIPVKLNAVSLDMEDIYPLIGYVSDKPVDVRFIELMPIGYGRELKGITHDILISALMDKFSGMERESNKHGNGPAVYYRIPGCRGSIGFISAIHGVFCDGCNRIRLTTKGYLKSCLCYDTGTDLKGILRNTAADEERRNRLISGIKSTILCKPKSHCFSTAEKISEKEPMSRIGG